MQLIIACNHSDTEARSFKKNGNIHLILAFVSVLMKEEKITWFGSIASKKNFLQMNTLNVFFCSYNEQMIPSRKFMLKSSYGTQKYSLTYASWLFFQTFFKKNQWTENKATFISSVRKNISEIRTKCILYWVKRQQFYCFGYSRTGSNLL